MPGFSRHPAQQKRKFPSSTVGGTLRASAGCLAQCLFLAPYCKGRKLRLREVPESQGGAALGLEPRSAPHTAPRADPTCLPVFRPGSRHSSPGTPRRSGYQVAQPPGLPSSRQQERLLNGSKERNSAMLSGHSELRDSSIFCFVLFILAHNSQGGYNELLLLSVKKKEFSLKHLT